MCLRRIRTSTYGNWNWTGCCTIDFIYDFDSIIYEQKLAVKGAAYG